MRTGLTIVATLAACCLSAVIAGEAPRASGQKKDDKAVQKHVRDLIAVFGDPEARGENLKQTIAAKEELTKIGAPAAPQLVATLLEEPASSNISFTSGQVLMAIGKPALPAVTARWADLTDGQRWRLMEFREKYDREAIREYVWNCLTSSDDKTIRLKAWGFALRHAEPRAKDRYMNALHGKERDQGGEDPHVRWWLLPTKPVYEEETEIDILIGLLKPDSWVAKGDGQIPPAGYFPPWWPDGRPKIIGILRERKITRAAPAMLKVLQEKGTGAGYLAEFIIPVLVEFKYADAVPELEKIATSKPAYAEPEYADLHPYATGGHKAVQKLATEATKKLRANK